jgi:hypothetical protein
MRSLRCRFYLALIVVALLVLAGAGALMGVGRRLRPVI